MSFPSRSSYFFPHELREEEVLCALCGPISEEETQACGLTFEKGSGVIYRHRRFLTEKQIQWRILREYYQTNSSLFQKATSIEHWRSHQKERIDSQWHTQDPELLISRARYALVAGKEQEFCRLYEAYTHTLHALSDHTHYSFFWEQVLGPGLEGAAEVPGKAQQEQLAHLISSHFALSAYPDGSLVCGRDFNSGHPSDMLYELRTANLTAMQQRQVRDGEQSLAAAGVSMLRGEWSKACRLFAANLPDDTPDFPRQTEGETVALYLHACLCAIRSEAPPSQFKRWLNIARRGIDLYLDSSYTGTSDLILMADLLEWAFRIRQHEGSGKPPCNITGAPVVPLLWGASHLLPSDREELHPATFPALVRELREKELTLFASYAAGSALPLVAPGSALKNELQELLNTLPRVAPLTDPANVPSADELQMELLEEWVSACASPRTHLYWDITLNSAQTSIQGIELRLVDAPELVGRRFTPQQHSWCELEELMDENDKKTIPLLEAMEDGTRNALREISCLVGHPRVRINRDGTLNPITVRGKRPELQILRKGNQVLIYQQSLKKPNQLEACTEHEITIPLTTRADLLTRERFQGAGDSLNKTGIISLLSPDPLRLQELLARLSQGFEICGDIVPPDLPESKATPELIAELSLKRGALCPRLLIRLLPASTCLITPGAGLTRIVLPDGEKLVYVKRDLKAEQQLVRHLLAQCPELLPIQPELFPPVFHALRHEKSQISLLQQLHSAGISITWSGEKRLSAWVATREQLALTMTGRIPGWLEMGGQLTVDEHRVFQLTELLEATLENSRIILKDGTHILTDEHVTRMLRQLRSAQAAPSAGSKEQRDTIRLSLAALPSICEAGKDLLPESLHRACPDLSEKKTRLPAGLQAKLRDYQLEGYRWMCARAQAGIGMCLADDMGLGKTVQTLALLLKRSQHGPALIIAPLSLLGNWLEETQRFAPTLTVKLYAEWDNSEALPGNSLLLASYGQLTSSPERAQATIWHTLVLDEAQNIRSHTTKRAKAILTLKAEARIALTGTPIENSLSDLWSIMNFLNPGMLGSLRTFRSRYRSGSELATLHTLIRPLILRRTRQQVLPQLPVLTEIEWKIDLNPEERALYEATRRRALNIMERHGTSAPLFAELTRLRRLCCHGKLAAPSFRGQSTKLNSFMELASELKASGHKALVFSQFTDVLDLLEPMLTKESIRFLRLDGSTKANRRTQLIDQFQRGEAEIFLLSLKAGGTGLNLTAASYVILLDPWWNPAAEAQAAARSRRIGQTHPVTLYRLIAGDTVEERVLALHQRKKELAESLITEGTLPLDELRSLLKD